MAGCRLSGAGGNKARSCPQATGAGGITRRPGVRADDTCQAGCVEIDQRSGQPVRAATKGTTASGHSTGSTEQHSLSLSKSWITSWDDTVAFTRKIINDV